MKIKKASFPITPLYRFGDLCPGDIILSTIPICAISAVIRITTHSQFSHAAVYRGEMNVLEAIEDGITNFNIMRRGVYNKKHVCVLRVVPSVNSNIIETALKAAESYRGRGYWFSGALKSLIGNKTLDASGRMFCSYFVAQIFADAGLVLCPGVLPYDVTPEMLLSSPHLIDKTEEVLVPIPAGFESAFEAIDSEQKTTPAHKILQIEREIVAQATKILQASNFRAPQTLDDLFKILVTEIPAEQQAELDSQLSEILEIMNYKDIDSKCISEISPAVNFPIAPTNMPRENLVATIGIHREILRKWNQRLNDCDEELAAGHQISELLPVPLQTLQLLQVRTRNRRQLIIKKIVNIQSTITELEQVYEERDNDN